MPKGTNISTEIKQKIWSYWNAGKSPVECHNGLFLGSEAACALKSLRDLYRMFSNPEQAVKCIEYLSGTSIRGTPVKCDFWYDELVRSLNKQDPTATVHVTRLQLSSINGDNFDLPCHRSVGDSLIRAKAFRKKTVFLSNAQDPVQVYHHMERMRAIETEDIVSWDETSCSSEQFKSTHGRGEGEVVLHDWRIGNINLSAIAAMTHDGFIGQLLRFTTLRVTAPQYAIL